MERREQYDPEDLEQLLLERSFDELLEEERAFVLRHLSGREEYASMRSLLLTMADPVPGPPPMDAAPHVREHVLKAFREQKRPRWTIMLNSIKAALIPQRTSDLWRPALAFGTLALVVTTAVFMWRTDEQLTAPTIVELKEPGPAPQAPARPAPSDAPQEQRNAEEAPAPSANLERPDDTPSSMAEVSTTPTQADASPPAPASPMEDLQRTETAKALEEESSASHEQTSARVQVEDVRLYHAVDAQDLSMNQSRANASPSGGAITGATVQEKRRKESAAASASSSVPVTPELLAMLRAAW